MISRIKNKLIVYHYNFVRRAIQKKQLEIEISNASISTNYLQKHSKRERLVEIKEEDDKLENVLFSCYFIKKENPQTGEVQGKANFEYIKE